MENRSDIDNLLENIEQGIEELLSSKDLGISELQAVPRLKDECKHLGDMFLLDSTRLTVFNRRYPKAAIDMPPLDTLFEVLKSVQRLERCSPPEIRLNIKLSVLRLLYSMRFLGSRRPSDGKWARYQQAFSERINELPKDNIFRKSFVDNTYGAEIEKRLISEVKAEIDKTTKPLDLALTKVHRYMTTNGGMVRKITSSEDITDFLGALNIVHQILKDPEAPQYKKACLLWWFSTRIWQIVHYSESRISDEFFNRRNELDRNNTLRNYAVSYYIGNKALDICSEVISKGDASKEYKEIENELYRQYGEEAVSVWDDEEEDRRYIEELPESVKKDLEDQETEVNRKLARTGEILNKEAAFKAEGKTDDEIQTLLGEDGRASLKEARLLIRGYTPHPHN